MESSQLADGPELSTEQRQLIENVASLAQRLREARPLEIGSIVIELQGQLAALAATIPAAVGNCPRDGALMQQIFNTDGTRYALCPYGHQYPMT